MDHLSLSCRFRICVTPVMNGVISRFWAGRLRAASPTLYRNIVNYTTLSYTTLHSPTLRHTKFSRCASYWFPLCVRRGKVDRTSVDGWLSAFIRFVMNKSIDLLLIEDVKERSAHMILFLSRPGNRSVEEKPILFVYSASPVSNICFSPIKTCFHEERRKWTYKIPFILRSSKKKKTFRTCVCCMHENFATWKICMTTTPANVIQGCILSIAYTRFAKLQVEEPVLFVSFLSVSSHGWVVRRIQTVLRVSS